MISVFISQSQVEKMYQEVAHYFQRDRLVNHRSTPEDELALLVNGKANLWVAIQDGQICGAAIAQHRNYERAPTYAVLTLGGDGGDWNELLKDLELFAAHTGCTHLDVLGRRGWLRRLDGFEESFTTISKRLNHV